MLDELIEIISSVEFEESESWLYLESIAWENRRRLSLIFALLGEDRPPQKWLVSCECVLAHRITDFKYGSLTLTFDHFILWPHTMPHQELYFSTKPKEPLTVYGALVDAHIDLVGSWFPVSRFINAGMRTIQLLSRGNGLLASGPRPIIERFCSVVDEYEIRHTVLPVPYGKIVWNSDLPPRALCFGDSYVAAHNIEAKKL